MANAPVRSDEPILPHDRWVAIGKSNCYLNEERSQLNPIFKIAVDILKQTNFFRAFTASSTIPSIYIQQFWDTIYFDIKAFCYRCQLDEQWYDLSSETLRDALEITPVDNNRAFTNPPSNRIWEELTQSIHIFLEDKKKMDQHSQGKKKATHILIPSIRFTKLIICHLQRVHHFHKRHGSPLHMPADEPEIAGDADLNPFKDAVIFRRMVKFIGVKQINLKGNIWESEHLIKNMIDQKRPPKRGDEEWHAKISLIDPDVEEFTKTFQSIPTTRKFSEKENLSEIFDLDHFQDS
nr:hypothetical protein [Tanacetum cinerariifolium]